MQTPSAIKMRHLELGQIEAERCEEVLVSLGEQAEWN